MLKNVETSQWAMALKGASDDAQGEDPQNMSERAADMLREEMEYLGPVKRSAVEAKQQEIVDVIRRLEDRGESTSTPSTKKKSWCSRESRVESLESRAERSRSIDALRSSGSRPSTLDPRLC